MMVEAGGWRLFTIAVLSLSGEGKERCASHIKPMLTSLPLGFSSGIHRSSRVCAELNQ